MKSLKLIALLLVCSNAMAQVKISEMTTTNGNPTGGWIPVVLGNTNYKIDAGKFYNKLDSLYKKSGTDSIFTMKNGVQQFAFTDSCNCCAEGPYIPQKTIAEMRLLSITPFSNKVYYIIDKDRQGMFRYDGDGSSTDDDGVMTLVTANSKKFKRIVDDHINVKWFGALGNGSAPLLSTIFSWEEAQKIFNPYTNDDLSSTDYSTQTIDWFALQAGINYCVNQNSAYTNGNYKKLYVPAGKYTISKALIASNWSTANSRYEFTTFTIEGESSFWSGAGGSFIYANFKKNFALGIHQGKGCKVKNLGFSGLFQHSGVITNRDFFAVKINDFDEFYDNTCEDKPLGPYSAIVIDPFLNRTITSGQESSYYQDLASYYRGNNANSGSTGTEIEDVLINNFVGGVVFSPNGETQNNEFSRIDKIQLNYLKAGIIVCQAQEKTNVIRHLAAWSDVHTVFVGSGYGLGTRGQWSIEDVNLAGRVNQFAYRDDGGYFPLFVRNFFSESLGKLGPLSSGVGGSFEDAEIGFAYPLETRSFPPSTPDKDSYFYMNEWQIDGGGVTFKNCNIRYYGTSVPVSIRGDFKFENCVFETVPYSYMDFSNGVRASTFLNCRTGEGGFGNVGVKSDYPNYFNRNVSYGSFILRDNFYNEYAKKNQFKYENYQPIREVGYLTTTVSTINQFGVAEINLTVDMYNKYYKFSKIVLMYNSYVLGQGEGYVPLGAIVDYNASTEKLRVSGIRANITANMSISMACALPVITLNPFMGDLQQSVSEIKNIRLDWGVGYHYGSDNPATLIGKVLLLKDVPAVYVGYKDYTVIYDYDAVNNSLKVSDLVVYSSKQGIYFCNGCEKQRDQKMNGEMGDAELMQRGSKITLQTSATEREYLVTKTGVYNSAGVSGESRQAEMVPAFNYNSHADGRFYGLANIYFASVADANTKIDAKDRRKGMSVVLLNGSSIEEYWYKDGIADADLVKKIPNSAITKITSDLTAVSTTTDNTATGLSFNVVAGESYRFTFTIVFSTAASTTGLRLGLTFPAATISTSNVNIPNGADATSALYSGWITSSGDVVISQGVQAANTNYVAIIEGTITPSSSGTVQLIYGSSVGGSDVQIKQSSSVKFEKY